MRGARILTFGAIAVLWCLPSLHILSSFRILSPFLFLISKITSFDWHHSVGPISQMQNIAPLLSSRSRLFSSVSPAMR
jgi:hypothetical protein